MHNNTPIVPYVSLCSGYEGIGLGLHRCIPNLRCIAYCEREAFAIANLVAKMENGLLDAAPVFTDVTTFPWEQFAPYMAGGILSFGWPCQPVSCAGKRKATEDERWLFDIIADGIALMRPGILFAENVEGLLSAKMPDGSLVFAHCIERLESLHYKVAAGIFSASEVGAPHQRKRVFIMANNTNIGIQGCGSGWFQEPQTYAGQALPVRCGNAGGIWPSRPGEQQFAWEPPRVVGNSLLHGHPSSEIAGGIGEGERGLQEPSGGSGAMGDAVSNSDRRSDRTRRRLREQEEDECARTGRQGDVQRQIEPALGRDADGPAGGMGYAELQVSCDNRTDELRLLGNGVVVATAEKAFTTLLGMVILPNENNNS